MQISAKTNYAIRALLFVAANDPLPVNVGMLAREGLPARFVENILGELRRGQLVQSRRGRSGGFTLARPAHEITLGEIVRVVSGPVSDVHGLAENCAPNDPSVYLPAVWESIMDRVAQLLDDLTLADILSGKFPAMSSDLPAADAAGTRVT
jgi:Rrf2 family protein